MKNVFNNGEKIEWGKMYASELTENNKGIISIKISTIVGN